MFCFPRLHLLLSSLVRKAGFLQLFYSRRMLFCDWRDRWREGWWMNLVSCVWGCANPACTQESRVTFVSELFQLRLLCSLLQLFLISQSIPLLSPSQHLRMDPLRQPPSITTPILHTDTHSHLPSHVKIATRTTTGVYTRLSVRTGFRMIYEGRE